MSKAFIGLTLALVLFVGVPVGCAVVSMTNSVATAPARVVTKTLETDNIIYNYEYFFNVNSQYNSRVAQIKSWEVETDADPAERQRLRVEVSAMRQSCRELANNYNANSGKMNRAIFRDHNLPQTLDASLCE
jgi:hypothetical protein